MTREGCLRDRGPDVRKGGEWASVSSLFRCGGQCNYGASLPGGTKAQGMPTRPTAQVYPRTSILGEASQGRRRDRGAVRETGEGAWERSDLSGPSEDTAPFGGEETPVGGDGERREGEKRSRGGEKRKRGSRKGWRVRAGAPGGEMRWWWKGERGSGRRLALA